MQDRLTAEAVEDWRERLQFAPDTPIRFEAEFWYRNDEARRESAKTDSPAFSAYYQFCWWIDKFASQGPEEDSELDLASATKTGGEEEVDERDLEKRLKALLTAVLDRLKLVVITLDESDDAQVIFETLNSKGEPLLAMDLVRNNIFHRAEQKDIPVKDLYEKLWGPLDDKWWREPAPNARPRRPRLDHFLAMC